MPEQNDGGRLGAGRTWPAERSRAESARGGGGSGLAVEHLRGTGKHSTGCRDGFCTGNAQYSPRRPFIRSRRTCHGLSFHRAAPPSRRGGRASREKTGFSPPTCTFRRPHPRRAHLRFVQGADQIQACIFLREAHGGARRPRRAVLASFPDRLPPSTPARRGRLAPPGALPSNQGAPKVEAEGRRVHKPEMRPIRARARNNRLEEGRGVA